MIAQKKKIRAGIVIAQMLLLIGMTISFAYFLHEASLSTERVIVYEKQIGGNLTLSKILKTIGILLFNDKGFVSALEARDLQEGAYTCIKTKDGKWCEEYPASECADKCAEDCVPSKRDKVAQCKLGTCYNAKIGTCQEGAPQAACTPANGTWINDPYGNVPECKKGCCVIGGKTSFITERQCARNAEVLGTKREFRANIATQIACLEIATIQEEGACVFEKDFERTCKFTTQAQCAQAQGNFYTQVLCSNPALNTTCKAQQTTACGAAKDNTQKIYWFDSCGNKENVFSLPKTQSWNNGNVLRDNETCTVGAPGNPVANAKTCGNCNYLLGSSCGKETDKEKASIGDVVCRDLSCIDENGKKRMHGESWCAYQGSIGLDKGANGLLRSTDIAGSRHFRKVCVNGEVKTEPCADYRNEICVEAKTPIPAGTFSSAACRINRWQQCYDYNTEVKSEDKAQREAQLQKRDEKCKKNSDCFLKEVNVDKKGFKFSLCSPRYPPGFDLTKQETGEGAEALCSLASQKCTVIYVNGLGGWSCKSNCDCAKPKFAEQMNDLCISLGDCGTKVNIAGDLTKNHKVFKSRKKDQLGKEIGEKEDVGAAYLEALKRYATPVAGKIADPGDLAALYGELGLPGFLNGAGALNDPSKAINSLGSTAGMIGVGIVAATYAAGVAYVGTGFGTSATLAAGSQAMGPALGAASGALAGAAIGFAVVSMLLSFTGVARGLPPEASYALMAAGAAAGAIIGANMALSGTAAGASLGAGGASFGASGLAFAAAVAWVVIAVVIVIIIIMAVLGIGKIKKVYYNFQCQPWQALTGGAKCNLCGKNSLPCSRYSCSALGQTCELLNEGTGNDVCVDIGANDAAAPIISTMKGIVPEGYEIEEAELGVKIKSTARSDGCIQETYEPIPFGISINEPAQCKISEEPGKNFDDIEMDFGGRNLYLRNHTMPLIIPSLESLGLEDIDPRAKTDFNFYVRCQDKRGNKNEKDYAIGFCIKQGPDTTPPIVKERMPYLETVQFNATVVEGSVYTNEPADCRWDTIDGDYRFMTNNMSCANEFEERQIFGWQCSTSFPVQADESNYYVRCADQPWLVEENETQRNVNSESYIFAIKRSKTSLNISSVNVEGKTLVFGTSPASVDVIVKTSGGLDGTAKCMYRWGNTTIDFFETLGSEHRQVFQTLYPGEIKLPIICKDVVGNMASHVTEFVVKLDTDAPKIARVYEQNGILTVITNENAQCAASTTPPKKGEGGCAFDFANGTAFDDEDIIHIIPFSGALTHYIKCKDSFGNNPGSSCSVVVKGVGDT